MRPALLRRAAACAPTSQTVLCILRRQRLPSRPAALPHVFFASSPMALQCVIARGVVSSPCALPPRIARSSRSGLAACKDAACAVAPVPRLPKMLAPSANVANVLPDFLRATPRCPAGRLAPRLLRARRPRPHGGLLRTTLSALPLLMRLVPVSRRAKMRPARCAAPRRPKDARAVRQIRRLFSRFSAGNVSLPSRPPWPRFLFHGACCARRCDLAVRLATPRCLRISLRSCGRAKMRPALLRCVAASNAARAACQIRRPFSRFTAGIASLPGRPPFPKLSSRPPPAASRGVVARDLAISPRALPRRVARASRSGLAACKNAARAVAPRRGVQSCLRRVPSSQTVVPNSPPATPRCLLPCRMSSTRPLPAASRCARCCDLAVRLATSR